MNEVKIWTRTVGQTEGQGAFMPVYTEFEVIIDDTQ